MDNRIDRPQLFICFGYIYVRMCAEHYVCTRRTRGTFMSMYLWCIYYIVYICKRTHNYNNTEYINKCTNVIKGNEKNGRVF